MFIRISYLRCFFIWSFATFAVKARLWRYCCEQLPFLSWRCSSSSQRSYPDWRFSKCVFRKSKLVTASFFFSSTTRTANSICREVSRLGTSKPRALVRISPLLSFLSEWLYRFSVYKHVELPSYLKLTLRTPTLPDVTNPVLVVAFSFNLFEVPRTYIVAMWK